jgi:hypothetical protein
MHAFTLLSWQILAVALQGDASADFRELLQFVDEQKVW